jgi:hypothetical protein
MGAAARPPAMHGMMGNAATFVPPSAAPRPQLNQVDRDKILQVAQFCASKGVAKLQNLKDNPTSRTVMPFLYEGNPGYTEFMEALKECVGLSNR